VDARGTAVEKKAQPKKLTVGQRHYLYRLALQAVDQFLKQRGFRSNTDASNQIFSYEKSRVLLDIALKSPENIAYVTSYAGYDYDPEVVRAKVVTAKDMIGSDLMIQIMVSTNDATGTRKPIFIPLPPDLPNPAQYVLRNVLGVLTQACEQIPKMREAFTEAEVQQAQEQFIDLPPLPPLLD